MDDIIDEIEEVDTQSVDKQAFAPVPVHFRPGEGKVKYLMLVIPNVEPPLAFFKVTGDTKDSITLEQVEGPAEEGEDPDSTPEGEVLEAEETSVDADKAEEQSQDADGDIEEEPESFDGPVDEEETESQEDEKLEGDIEYPYEDEAGNPVAGFLIDDSEDASLPVVVVKPQEGETAEEAIERVSKDHENHRVATLDQAIALIGHNPLTSEDN